MKPYNLIIRLGRALNDGVELDPEKLVAIVDIIDREMRWKSVDEFFKFFPPIKNYEDDGFWTYKDAVEYIKNNFGERFTKDDFYKLLMTHLYESPHLQIIGSKYMLALSELNRRRTGISLATQFFVYGDR